LVDNWDVHSVEQWVDWLADQKVVIWVDLMAGMSVALKVVKRAV
jgi:hypothetical protein